MVKDGGRVRMCLLLDSFRSILQLQRPAATLVLLGFALQSSALTIGRPQGAAWIGKPLDVVIPLTLDEAEAVAVLCLEAEVLQGDTRVDDKRVTVSLEPGADRRQSARAHVRSTVADRRARRHRHAACRLRHEVDAPLRAVCRLAGRAPRCRAFGAVAVRHELDPRARGAAAARAVARCGGATPRRARAAGSGTDAAPRAARARAQRRRRRRRRAERRDRLRPPRRAARPLRPPRRRAARRRRRACASRAAPQSRARERHGGLAPAARSAGAAPRRARPASRARRHSRCRPAKTRRGAPRRGRWRAHRHRSPRRRSERHSALQALEATLDALREQTAQNQRTLLELRSELTRRARAATAIRWSMR